MRYTKLSPRLIGRNHSFPPLDQQAFILFSPFFARSAEFLPPGPCSCNSFPLPLLDKRTQIHEFQILSTGCLYFETAPSAEGRSGEDQNPELQPNRFIILLIFSDAIDILGK